MKVKFEVKNGKFRFFILNRVLKLLLCIDHAKYKATSSEKCKKTFQQMAPLINANFNVSPLVALRRVRITAIAVLLVLDVIGTQEITNCNVISSFKKSLLSHKRVLY